MSDIYLFGLLPAMFFLMAISDQEDSWKDAFYLAISTVLWPILIPFMVGNVLKAIVKSREVGDE